MFKGYGAIDSHHFRSVTVRRNPDVGNLSTVNIDNGAVPAAAAIADAGPNSKVVAKATDRWYSH